MIMWRGVAWRHTLIGGWWAKLSCGDDEPGGRVTQQNDPLGGVDRSSFVYAGAHDVFRAGLDRR